MLEMISRQADTLMLWLTAALALLVGPALVPALLRSLNLSKTGRTVLSLWVQACFLLVVVARDGTGLAGMGLALPTGIHWVWVPAGTALCVLITFGGSALLMAGGKRDQAASEGLAWLQRMPPGEVLLVSATAGIAEEWIYRGVALSRIAMATGSLWVGALISGAFFVLHHRKGWGWKWLIAVGLVTVVMTGIYIATGNLVVVMLIHFLTDLLSFWGARQALRAHARNESPKAL